MSGDLGKKQMNFANRRESKNGEQEGGQRCTSFAVPPWFSPELWLPLWSEQQIPLTHGVGL